MISLCLMHIFFSNINYIVLSWRKYPFIFPRYEEKSTHAGNYPIFLMILSLDDILCIALSILCQHLEKLMTLCTEVYFMNFGPVKLKE